MKIKTTFWEEINTKKVAKLIYFLTAIQAANTITLYVYQNWILAGMNTLILILLITINLSYNKYEGEEHKRKKEQ